MKKKLTCKEASKQNSNKIWAVDKKKIAIITAAVRVSAEIQRSPEGGDEVRLHKPYKRRKRLRLAEAAIRLCKNKIGKNQRSLMTQCF